MELDRLREAYEDRVEQARLYAPQDLARLKERRVRKLEPVPEPDFDDAGFHYDRLTGAVWFDDDDWGTERR